MKRNEAISVEMLECGSQEDEDNTTPLNPDLEKYRNLFNRFDTDGNGVISLLELSEGLNAGQFREDEISPLVISRIHYAADKNRDGRLNFDEFVDMVQDPSNTRYFRRFFNNYVEALVPGSIRMRRNKWYASQYKCWPPPIGMIVISLVEVILHAVDAVMAADTQNVTGPTAQLLLFNPCKRQELWRFMTYMFVHAGGAHLAVNLIIQIAFALPLEMVHRWWRILTIYLVGVLTASLCHSIFHPFSCLAGASGGTYSVITAHIATLIMNWTEMKYRTFHLLFLTILIGSDLGSSIYENVVLHKTTNVGYVAHIGGAIAGLLVGINVMRNLRQTRPEVVIWWISMVLIVSIISICILLNLFWTDHFPHKSQFPSLWFCRGS